MALTSYVELQASIASWLARDDLTAYIPDFIRLFEAAAQRKLKVRLQETTTTLTVTAGVATVPSDYLGARDLVWTGSPRHSLTYLTPTQFNELYGDQVSGIPTSYTIQGSVLTVGQSDDTSLTLNYFQRTPALSGALNWLYTNHPDAYLFGSLCEANAFDKDVDAAGLWKARRDEVFNEIAMLDFNDRPMMQVAAAGPTP